MAPVVGIGRGRARRAVAKEVPLPGFSAPPSRTLDSLPPLTQGGVGGPVVVVGESVEERVEVDGRLVSESLDVRMTALALDDEGISVSSYTSPEGKSGLDSSTEDSLSSVGATAITAPLVPGTLGAPTSVKTNLYDLQFKGNGIFHRYRVDLEAINLGSGRGTDMGKGAGNDHVLNKKREQCWRVFQRVVREKTELFPDPRGVAYDRRNLLVSKDMIDLGETESGSVTVEVGAGEMPGVEWATKFIFRLQYESRLNLADFSGLVTPQLDDRDRQTVQMLEIIISQQLFSNDGLVHFGCKTYEKMGKISLGNGRYFVQGAHHSLIPTSDPRTKEPMLSLVLDSKSGAFYIPQEAMLTLCETLSSRREQFRPKDFQNYTMSPQELRKAFDNFREVNVRDTVQKMNLTIDGLTHEPASKLTVEHFDEKKDVKRTIALPVFYRDILKAPLNYPHLQCFYQRTKTGKRYHPIEVCWVNECQRVPLPKQTPEQMQTMIKESAKKPTDMQKNLDGIAKSTQLLTNETLRAMGLEMGAKPRTVPGRILPAPTIQYTGGSTKGRAHGERNPGDWEMTRGAKYIRPGSCGKWKAISLVPAPNPAIKTGLGNFVQFVAEQAASKGLVMGKCDMKCQNPNGIEVEFKQDVDFLLFIISDLKENTVKDSVKLNEHRYGIPTQCVTISKAMKIGTKDKGSGQILENIVNKTNMKMGGINYHLTLDKKVDGRWLKPNGKVMILGCDVNHPPPQPPSLRHLPPREPSVVGFVGNNPRDPLLFTGELSFQGPREELVQDMDSLAQIFAARWVANSPSAALPEEIIYFRDGVSDGQFQQVMDKEVEDLRNAFKAQSKVGDYDPRLTVIVAKKRHNLRMFAGRSVNEAGNARSQDIAPGTVLDAASGVTHPGQANSYLKSHSAIQGTARATHYTFLLNEGEYKQDDLDAMIYALAHDHQIVNKPVSIPAPVMGGHEMAERGKRIWRAFNEEEMSSGRGSSVDDVVEHNWADITRMFQVSKHPRLSRAKHWA